MPLARYRLRFRALGGAEALKPLRSEYLGTAWRGAFGAALRDAVCVTRQPVCGGCALLRSCAYPVIFESSPPAGAEKLTRYPRTPGPYVLVPEPIDPGQPDGLVDLGLTLFGSANERFAYVAHALERAGRAGLTKHEIKFELREIRAENPTGAEASDGCPPGSTEQAFPPGPAAMNEARWSLLYEPGGAFEPMVANSPVPGQFHADARLWLLTPLRLRRDDKPIRAEQLDFKAFMSPLLRRISMLSYFFSPTPLEADFADLTRKMGQIEIHERNLGWRELTRYSSRQKTRIPVGGLTGSFRLAGNDLRPFWPYLWLGQWTHAGRGCTMGFGRYSLEPPNTESGMDSE